MITLPELLTDTRYRKFFTTVPQQGAQAMNWRIYVQRKPDGVWARKDFASYREAFHRIAREIKSGNLHDGTIQSRGVAYGPPQRIVGVTKGGKPVYIQGADGSKQRKTALAVWKPRLHSEDEPHIWCTYCRRPTVFQWFHSHHALRGTPLHGLTDPGDRRCTICGAREEFVLRTVKSSLAPGSTLNPKPRRRNKRK